MKINFYNQTEKRFVEILPSMTLSWYSGYTFYLGWLFWSITIDF
jgi:hypothetical protein